MLFTQIILSSAGCCFLKCFVTPLHLPYSNLFNPIYITQIPRKMRKQPTSHLHEHDQINSAYTPDRFAMSSNVDCRTRTLSISLLSISYAPRNNAVQQPQRQCIKSSHESSKAQNHTNSGRKSNSYITHHRLLTTKTTQYASNAHNYKRHHHSYDKPIQTVRYRKSTSPSSERIPAKNFKYSTCLRSTLLSIFTHSSTFKITYLSKPIFWARTSI